MIKGKLPDHSVPSRTEKSNTWGKGNNKTPRADDATEKPTQEPYSCFSREHFRREKDIRKRKPDLELSALNSLIPLDSNGYKEETSISFQTTLPVVAPVSHSTPSPVLKWNGEEDQLVLVRTDGGVRKEVSSDTPDIGLALETVKPAASTGLIKISSNCKNNLPDYPTHKSDPESRKDMERHHSGKQGFCTAGPGKESEMDFF